MIGKQEAIVVAKLASFDRAYKDKEERLQVSVKELNGKRFIDIRIWYLDRQSGEWRPGKGATIREREAEDFARAMQVALAHIGSAAPAPRQQEFAQNRGSTPPPQAPAGEDDPPW
jgi:hypothetical protein